MLNVFIFEAVLLVPEVKEEKEVKRVLRDIRDRLVE
jgi:hypothetical protein